MPDEEKVREILDFIRHFEDCENTFEYDGGYWFALILINRFPDGEIAVAPERQEFVAWIDDHAYNIDGDVTEKYDHGELKNWERLRKTGAKYAKFLEDYCVLLKNEPRSGPNIDNLESRYGFFTTENPNKTFVLMNLPTPASGPEYEKFGPHCIAAYAIETEDTENIPTGRTCIAVWTNITDFHNNQNPAGIIYPKSK